MRRLLRLGLIGVLALLALSCATAPEPCAQKDFPAEYARLTGDIDLMDLAKAMRRKKYTIRYRFNSQPVPVAGAAPAAVPAERTMMVLSPKTATDPRRVVLRIVFDGTHYYATFTGPASCETPNATVLAPALRTIADVPLTDIQRKELRERARVVVQRP